jgi:hypothetical protein
LEPIHQNLVNSTINLLTKLIPSPDVAPRAKDMLSHHKNEQIDLVLGMGACDEFEKD